VAQFAQTEPRALVEADEPPALRNETDLERVDRNLNELLQELRVVATGVQVLFAFLLIVPFSAGFSGLGHGERYVYFAILLATAAAAGLLIAPTALHRLIFRRGDKPYLIEVANRMAISGITFDRCDFGGAGLSDVRTEKVTFTGCSFVGAELHGSQHRFSSFVDCTFDRTSWHGAVLTGCRVLGSTFTDCRLRPFTVAGCDLSLSSFGGERLMGTDFSGVRLREANLTGTDLSNCNFAGADLTGARAGGAILKGADLRGARIDTAFWVAAKVAGAMVDIDQALLYAAAHGLVLEEPSSQQ
jgi:uncharacterized protein YjbI with pentapeptide repeats